MIVYFLGQSHGTTVILQPCVNLCIFQRDSLEYFGCGKMMSNICSKIIQAEEGVGGRVEIKHGP